MIIARFVKTIRIAVKECFEFVQTIIMAVEEVTAKN